MQIDFPCSYCKHLKSSHNDRKKNRELPDCNDCHGIFDPFEIPLHDYKADNLKYLENKYDSRPN